MTIKEYLTEGFYDSNSKKLKEENKKVLKIARERLMKKMEGMKKEYDIDLPPEEKARIDKMLGLRRAGRIDRARVKKMESEDLGVFTRKLVKDVKDSYSKVPEFGIKKSVQKLFEFIDSQKFTTKEKDKIINDIIRVTSNKPGIRDFYEEVVNVKKHFKFKNADGNGKHLTKVS
jgi:hypothetical protein